MADMSLCLGGQGLAFTFFFATRCLLRPLCCPKPKTMGLARACRCGDGCSLPCAAATPR